VKLSLARASLVSLVALVTLGAFVACADTEEPAAPGPSGDDGAAIPPVDGGPLADATADADAEAAAPRECSDQNFCHTAVPAGTPSLRGVWGDGAGTVWAISEEGAVLRWETSASGGAWKVHASGLGPLRAIWGSGPTEIWVAGDKGIYRGTGASAAALTFTGTPNPGGAPLKVVSLFGLSPTDIWAVGSTPTDPPVAKVLHYTGGSTEAGTTWAVDAVTSRKLAFTHVWGSAASGVWVAGYRPVPGDEFVDESLVFRKLPAATTFAEVVLPRDPNEDPVFGRLSKVGGVSFATDSAMFIVGRTPSNMQATWRGTSTNGGQTFTFTYLRGGYEEPHIHSVSGVAPNDVWAVGDYGRVRHWDGAEWKQAAVTVTKVPLTAPIYGVWTRGPSELWAVGDGVALHRKP